MTAAFTGQIKELDIVVFTQRVKILGTGMSTLPGDRGVVMATWAMGWPMRWRSKPLNMQSSQSKRLISRNGLRKMPDAGSRILRSARQARAYAQFTNHHEVVLMPDAAFTGQLKKGAAEGTIVGVLTETPTGWSINIVGTRNASGGYTLTGTLGEPPEWLRIPAIDDAPTDRGNT